MNFNQITPELTILTQRNIQKEIIHNQPYNNKLKDRLQQPKPQKIVFRPQTTKKYQQDFITARPIPSVFQNKQLSITQNDKNQFQEYWNITEWDLRKIFCNKSNNNILKAISHIDLLNLKAIDIWRCSLQSVEPIIWLNFPSLRLLSLEDNHLTSLQPFARTNFGKLESFSLLKNHEITDQFRVLSRCKLAWNLSRLELGFQDQLNMLINQVSLLKIQTVKPLKTRASKMNYQLNYERNKIVECIRRRYIR